MKKLIIYIIAVVFFSSCEDKLTKEPNFASESNIFESKRLTEAYLASIYEFQLFYDTSGQENFNFNILPAMAAEARNFANFQGPNVTFQRTFSEETGPGLLDYWPYDNIRDMNFVLENIINSETFTEEYINSIVAEVRCLRVFSYFELAKRYGAVPLITEVQELDDENLLPNRTPESEVFEFMLSELDELMPELTTEVRGARGRIDQYTAQALKSRVALYAASIANFGEVQLDGLVGIPQSKAQEYYQASYDASTALMNSGNFQLYNQLDDKTENYIQLFLDEGNSEVIFAEIFEPYIRGTSLDRQAIPAGFGSSWNSNYPVYYNFAEQFDFVDGRKGTDIDRDNLVEGNYWDIDGFFGERDPRFKASVFYPEVDYQDGTVYFHQSSFEFIDGEKESYIFGFVDNDGEEWPASVISVGQNRNARNTSLLMRKRLDESNTTLDRESSGQDFYVFRYAEILLNHAEAAFYLNKDDDEILNSLNEIRNRAGMPELTEASIENIRNERTIELCFEGQRYWDLIRWRTAREVLDGLQTKGLIFNYNLDEDNYEILITNDGLPRTFTEAMYYLPLSIQRLADNPNLRPNNPGY